MSTPSSSSGGPVGSETNGSTPPGRPSQRAVPPGPPDAELVRRARDGERDAFGLLAERYYRMVSILALQKVGHRADAEDIVQEAFVRAYRALETLREPDKFGAWVYHIALKLCIDWVRRRERRDAPASLDEPNVRSEASGHATTPAPLQILVESEEEGKVLSAIGGLPDKYRLIVTLRYVRKLSYKEIADHLGEPAGTIANRIHRATKMLKDSLGIEDGGPMPPGAGEDEPEASPPHGRRGDGA